MGCLLVCCHLSSRLVSGVDFFQRPPADIRSLMIEALFKILLKLPGRGVLLKVTVERVAGGMNVKSQQHCSACVVTVRLSFGPEAVEVCQVWMEAVPVLEVFAVGLRRAVHPLIPHRFDKFLLRARRYIQGR